MLLACAECDDSKAARPYAEWMVGETPKSPRSRGVTDVKARIDHLKAYVAAYGYMATPVEAGLTRPELDRLTNVRGKLAALRDEIDSLVRDYRDRTGYR